MKCCFRALGVLFAFCVLGCALHSPTCLVEGTPVRTPSGERPVESIAVGDRLLTRTDATNLIEVVVRDVRQATSTRGLQFGLKNGRTLSLTPEHPVAIPGGWRNAGELEIGDDVLTETGTTSIAAISRIREKRRVFDLSVSPEHTFLAAGVLVHNKTMERPPTLERLVGSWVAIGDNGQLARLQIRADGAFLFVSRDYSSNLWEWAGTVPLMAGRQHLDIGRPEVEVVPWSGKSAQHGSLFIAWRFNSLEVRSQHNVKATRHQLFRESDVNSLFRDAQPRVEKWLKESEGGS